MTKLWCTWNQVKPKRLEINREESMLTKWRSSIDLLPPKLYKQTCPPNIYLVCDDVCECYSLSAWFAQVVERLTSDPKVPGSTPGSVKLRQKVLNNYKNTTNVSI